LPALRAGTPVQGLSVGRRALWRLPPQLLLCRFRRRSGRLRHSVDWLPRLRPRPVAGGLLQPAALAALRAVGADDRHPRTDGAPDAEGPADRSSVPQQGRGRPPRRPAMTQAGTARGGWGLGQVVFLAAALVALAILLGLGTWQVQRLGWKENLIATIEQRVTSEPRPLAEIEQLLASEGDVDYWPVTVEGTFRHEGERHFFATHEGKSGY